MRDNATSGELYGRIAELEREVAELRADAQRYRALCRLDDWTYCEGYTPEELNAFLDKLYAEQSAQGHAQATEGTNRGGD